MALLYLEHDLQEAECHESLFYTQRLQVFSAALPASQAWARVITDIQIVRLQNAWLTFKGLLLCTSKSTSLPICTFFFAQSVTLHDVSFAAESEWSWARYSSFSTVSGCNRCTKNNSSRVCYDLNANERIGTGRRCDSDGDIECLLWCLLALRAAGAWFQK